MMNIIGKNIVVTDVNTIVITDVTSIVITDVTTIVVTDIATAVQTRWEGRTNGHAQNTECH
jgi:hypothetical protein